jgi:hypothetical protein
MRTARDVIRINGPWESRPLYSKNRAQDTVTRAERPIDEFGKGEPFLIVYSDGSCRWQTLDWPLRTLRERPCSACSRNWSGSGRWVSIGAVACRTGQGATASRCWGIACAHPSWKPCSGHDATGRVNVEPTNSLVSSRGALAGG